MVLICPLEVTVYNLRVSGQNEDGWPRHVTGVRSMGLYTGAVGFPGCGVFISSGRMEAREWGEGLSAKWQESLSRSLSGGEFEPGVGSLR